MSVGECELGLRFTAVYYDLFHCSLVLCLRRFAGARSWLSRRDGESSRQRCLVFVCVACVRVSFVRVCAGACVPAPSERRDETQWWRPVGLVARCTLQKTSACSSRSPTRGVTLWSRPTQLAAPFQNVPAGACGGLLPGVPCRPVCLCRWVWKGQAGHGVGEGCGPSSNVALIMGTVERATELDADDHHRAKFLAPAAVCGSARCSCYLCCSQQCVDDIFSQPNARKCRHRHQYQHHRHESSLRPRSYRCHPRMDCRASCSLRTRLTHLLKRSLHVSDEARSLRVRCTAPFIKRAASRGPRACRPKSPLRPL